MPIALNIRAAEACDIPALHRLYKQLNPEDSPPEPQEAERIFEQFRLYRGSAIFVGTLGGSIVRTCTLVVIPNLMRSGRPYALIENVVTDSACRKRGYGRAVLQAAIASAWHSDCYKVMLLTGSRDPETLRFYEETGFEQSKTGFQIR